MVSIYSFGQPLSLPDIDEDLDDEDVGIYLETACNKCQQYSKKVENLSDKVENLQTLLTHREHHLKYLQDASDYLKQKTEHQDLALAEMRKYREIVLKELANTRDKLSKALKENQRLQHEIEKMENEGQTPAPPPPPPPPPPSLLRFLPSFTKKPRSKSMSRIECRRKPMLLSDDILDAIRNKKYSLRKVEPPELGPLKIITVDNESQGTRMLSRLIDRRVRMEYSDADETDDDDRASQF